MSTQTSFHHFYQEVFLPEHRAPANIALHVLGTVLGVAYVAAAALSPWPLAVLAWPVIHVAPGLVGHRFFERHEEVGDARFLRTDHPRIYFLLANHLMTLDVLRGAWPRRPQAER